MEKEIIKVGGFKTFAKNEKAPDFVLGTLIIDIAEFKEFINANLDLLTEYKGKKQLKCQMLSGKYGVNINVDTWKPTSSQSSSDYAAAEHQSDSDDLPFI